MKLTYRPTEERDLPECVRLVQHGPAPPGAADRLLHVWCALRTRDALNSAVMEDQERPAGRRLVHFGASVFVTDDFAREVRARPRPCLSDVVLDRILAGHSPVLDAPAIRHANTGGGLNVFVLHVGMAAALDPDERQAVLARAPDTFFLVHQGFRLKEILLQYEDEGPQRFAEAGGFQWRDRASGLLGLTREEARARPGAYAGRLFAYEPPRLGFGAREQQILQRALLGETDAETAEALHLATDTVKARWRGIYGRVAERAPELLPQGEGADLKRGAEKRRHLLHYLRHHPEELRPV